MNTDEKQMINGLFTRLGEAERTAPPRDADAEAFIRDRVSSQPGAPYYMAQTILVQEQALEAAQARIQELEQQAHARPAGGGGFLGGLFGGGSREPQRPMGAPSGMGSTPWGNRGQGMPQTGMQQPGAMPAGRGGGGFMAGAAQTAVGVAGGMMLGSMLGGLFGGADEAIAGGLDQAQDGIEETGLDDFGGDDFGGDDEI